MSEEMTKIGYKWLKKWLFPDFSNKITWAVLTAGTSFLLVPAPVKLFILNWLVDIFNVNSGLPLELPDIEASTDYTIGIILVVLALGHNLGYKYFSLRKEQFEYAVSKELKLSDYKLLESFLTKLPSTCNSLVLLKDHDFGNSFYRSHLKELEEFVRDWHASEYQFQDEAIDESRQTLIKLSNEFLYKLGSCMSPRGTSGLYSVVPQQFAGAVRPQWLSDEIKVLNDKATELYQVHQKFIILAKKQL